MRTVTSSIVVMFRTKAACCSTRGLVGAMKSTFPPFPDRMSAMTRRATIVLPMPVGRTTMVDLSTQALAMLIWYALASTFPGRTRGCSTYTTLAMGA